MKIRHVNPAGNKVRAAFSAPPSKSVTHRAMLAAALASGTSSIVDPLDSDDTRVTREGLQCLGFRIESEPGRWTVEGRSGRVPGGGNIALGQSGTSFRFLLALAAIGSAPSRLDGAPRLRERPSAELVRAIARLGGRASFLAGRPALPIEAGGAPLCGGRVAVDSGESSQFASAMLLIGSRLPGGLELTLGRSPVSLPYVELTAGVLREFGVPVERRSVVEWRVPETDYPGRSYRVEGDHSSASYLLASAAVLGADVRVDRLDPGSAQPDARLPSILEQLGCRVERGGDWVRVVGHGTIPGFEREMAGAPDLVPTLAVLAMFAEGACKLTGIPHLRLKESDRLAVIADNIERLGGRAKTMEDGLVVEPPRAGFHGGTIRTASDHRIAMAFAVAGLRVRGVSIDDADCVAKSNPGFWEQLAELEGPS